MAWIMSFEAVQDNDPNVVNKLSIAVPSDDLYSDSQFNNIKIGGTTTNILAYTLTDTTTPVVLTARSIVSTEYGSQTFDVSQ